ncbi:OmpA family protein [Phaeovulum vinaykumarii]|uniref:OmpA family protein n=1 Tax=Phaeovulum vinaykumarii TaxID=407234 RepID=A0A1N7L2F1_9RHOB|nr:OmpA family protein [Phaeovulum vinaykumarii]SIS67926.1 OmpA family protein [Phaeovulum vinaykumarii]SOC00467.1 OmpA family protein [Phaeovulum vinaykumarii]
MIRLPQIRLSQPSRRALPRRALALLAVLALAAGCSTREVGAELDTGSFGNSTMNNALVQSGLRDFAVNMNNRFAAEVPNTVNFAFDSAVLDGTARAALDRQANWIRQFPEIRFRVYGHTDLVGSNAYNKQLGLRRARAVVNYLAARGISRSRLEAVVSFGETQPLIFTQQPELRNRRTVTEVSGFVSRKPQLLNGKYAQLIFREYVESGTWKQRSGQELVIQSSD